MPVDETKAPGPDEHESQLLWREIINPLIKRGAVYYSYNFWNHTSYLEYQEALHVENERIHQEAVEAAKVRIEEKRCKHHVPQKKPSHVGPRKGPAFRNGKKRF